MNEITQAALRLVGKEIERQRSENNVSLHQLSAASGMPEDFLCEIEKGQADVSFAMLQAIAEAMQSLKDKKK